MKKPTKKESKPMKLEVKKINTKQYKTREEYNEAHKNDSKTETKKKVIRKKNYDKQTKTDMKKVRAVKIKAKDWRTITVEDPSIQKYLIWRPRIFKSPDEMIDLFNHYIASCREKTKKSPLVPVRTEQQEDDFLKDLDDAIKASKGDKFKIDNSLVAEYEIVEWDQWKETPTVWWFLRFCWWISYQTWWDYKRKEEFSEATSQIENVLETILTERAIAWEIPSNIAQFILNVNYGRVPKSKSEEVIKTDPIDVSELIQN